MPEKGYRCHCCDLVYVDSGPMCSVCAYHQSPDINQDVKRHSDHAAIRRGRLVPSTECGRGRDRRAQGYALGSLRSRERTIKVLG